MKRWLLLVVLAALVGCAAEEAPRPRPEFGPAWVPDEPTIASLQDALRSGETTCAELVESRLERIARFELSVSGGPPLNAFVMLNESIREQARALDAAALDSGQLVGPLHCVPFVVKTNYGAEEVDVTNGAIGLRSLKGPQATAVTRLKAQGALLIGSTSMDEFARGVYGIGSAHGRTGNSYRPELSPGGSSAGAAVAVSAGFAMGGLGTDNCGSLTVPAAYNGLVTLRGSRHRVPLDGIFPGNPRDAVAGPLARNVTDLAWLLDVTANTPGHHVEALVPDALVGKRIGVLRALPKNTKKKYRHPYATKNPAVVTVWDAAIADFQRLGAEVVEDVTLTRLKSQRRFGGWEQAVQDWFAGAEPSMSFEGFCDSGGYSAQVWADEATCRSKLEEGLRKKGEDPDPRYQQNAVWVQARMDALNLDALLLPVDAHGVARAYKASPNCILTSVTGLPSATVVSGQVDGLPVGMQLVGREGGDSQLIGFAYAYEQGTRHRRSPGLVGPAEAPPLDLVEHNALHVEIARQAYVQVLKEGARKDLAAEVFTALAREVIGDQGQTHLLP